MSSSSSLVSSSTSFVRGAKRSTLGQVPAPGGGRGTTAAVAGERGYVGVAAAPRTLRSTPLGTKPSVHTGQLLISSGLADFDSLVGGGFPLGSVVLILEDTYSQYCFTLLRYVLAEGISCGHRTVVVSADGSPHDQVCALPYNVTIADEERSSRLSTNEEDKKASSGESESRLRTTSTPVSALNSVSSAQTRQDQELRIAWQYNKYIAEHVEKEKEKKSRSVRSEASRAKTGVVLCHTYDLSKPIQSSLLEGHSSRRPSEWDMLAERGEGENAREGSYPSFSMFDALLHRVSRAVEDLASADESKEDSILRIAIFSLGSPLWTSDSMELVRSLHRLRAILRGTRAVCFLTIPKCVHSSAALTRCCRISDYAFEMESFAGGGVEVGAYEESEFSGWLLTHRISRQNSLVAVDPPDLKVAFKMRRRSLVIERFHLGPEESRATDENRPRYDPNLEASSSSSKAPPSTPSTSRNSLQQFDF